jgi:hypothetical protein
MLQMLNKSPHIPPKTEKIFSIIKQDFPSLSIVQQNLDFPINNTMKNKILHFLIKVLYFDLTQIIHFETNDFHEKSFDLFMANYRNKI